MKKKVYLLVTIDGDLRVGTIPQQKAGVRAMREAHRKLGLHGKTTWMINEVDFAWTAEHGELLIDLIDSDECIGVHDHLDTHFAETFEDALDLMTTSHERLEAFFNSNRKNIDLLSHRNGCALQSEFAYRAAKALGYQILSDVWPGEKWYARMLREGEPPNPWVRLEADDPRAICMDNQMVPLKGSPWRHDVGNWLDTSSQEGWFLHLPINSMPMMDRERVTTAVDDTDGDAFIVLDTHPYDLQDEDTGEVSPVKVDHYIADIAWMFENYSVGGIRLHDVPDLMTNHAFDKAEPGVTP